MSSTDALLQIPVQVSFVNSLHKHLHICRIYNHVNRCHMDVRVATSSSLPQVLDEWNKGELSSFLIEITRDILKFADADGQPLLEKIRDTAGQVCEPSGHLSQQVERKTFWK